MGKPKIFYEIILPFAKKSVPSYQNCKLNRKSQWDKR
nr:MAG TPA: hypothetical protein [Caudoviricetes sp.]